MYRGEGGSGEQWPWQCVGKWHLYELGSGCLPTLVGLGRYPLSPSMSTYAHILILIVTLIGILSHNLLNQFLFNRTHSTGNQIDRRPSTGVSPFIEVPLNLITCPTRTTCDIKVLIRATHLTRRTARTRTSGMRPSRSNSNRSFRTSGNATRPTLMRRLVRPSLQIQCSSPNWQRMNNIISHTPAPTTLAPTLFLPSPTLQPSTSPSTRSPQRARSSIRRRDTHRAHHRSQDRTPTAPLSNLLPNRKWKSTALRRTSGNICGRAGNRTAEERAKIRRRRVKGFHHCTEVHCLYCTTVVAPRLDPT